jgi:hypothetical protein
MVEALFARKSVGLVGAAVFGSLAALSTVVIPARIQPAFPILPFLRFDPAELFSVLAFLIFGPIPAFIFTPLSVKIPEIASANPWISKFTKR